MSEEEKKAIDILINEIAEIVVGEYCTHCKICENEDTECYYTKVIETVYKLILKQQKEIEEVKKDRDNFKKALEEKITYCNELEKDLFENCSNYVVSKEKIKAKIEEVDQWELYNMKIPKLRTLDGRLGAKIGIKYVLQSLLKEE